MAQTNPPPSVRVSEVEGRVQEIGRRLLDRARHGRGWWTRLSDDLLMGPLMRSDALRVASLRFVDVLPMLHGDADLAAHLQEYFNEVDVPGVSQAVRRWVLKTARGGLASHAAAAAVRAMAGRMARRFIAGDTIETAGRVLHDLRQRGMAFTLDLLGEAVMSEAEAAGYHRQYLELLAGLDPIVRHGSTHPLLDRLSGRPAPRLNLSLKVSALFSQISPADPTGSVAAIKEKIRPILHEARRRGAFITLDMEHYDTKDITLRLFREVLTEPEFRDWPDAGIAVQAYLRDTPADLADLIAWAKIRGAPVMVRLVRGAYWDFETVHARQHGWRTPVWTRKAETDACYEHCLSMLLAAHPHVETAIATHNVRSLAVGIALAERMGLAPGQYETQMLFGMADEVKAALVEEGLRLRVYVPFGELIPGMAYLVRRLLENTGSQSFLRMGFSEDLDADELLAPPPPARARSESAIAIVDVAGNLFTSGTSKERRNAAMRWALEHLRGTYMNDATGWAIQVSRHGLKHTINTGGLYSSTESLPALPSLIQNALLVESRPARKEDRRTIKSIHRLYAAARIAGVLNRVKITVRETPDGRKFYEHHATRLEIKKAPFKRAVEAGSASHHQGPTITIGELLDGVKGHDGRPAFPTETPEASAAPPKPANQVPFHSSGTDDVNNRPFANQPVRRFADEAERRAFARAIDSVRGQLGREYPLIINGTDRKTSHHLRSINPAHPSQLVGITASASPDDANAALEAATRVSPAWRDTPVEHRAQILFRAADLMRISRDELSAWEVFEGGKPWREADADVCEAIDFLEYYARQALRLHAGQNLDVPGETNRYYYEPRGVVVVIAPWNFPLAILCGMTAAALVTGNTVVMKPAPQTPVIAAHLSRILHESGLPPGVLNYLPGGDGAGDALVRDPRTHMIAFTGSVPVGKIIANAAAQLPDTQHHLKHVIAELGGKNAIIIDTDADLDEAVLGVMASAFGYAGQKCSACSRAIVIGGLHDAFLARLTEAAASLRIGDPADPGAYMGPVIDRDAFDRIRTTIDSAASYCRPLLRPDVSSLGDGYYVGPTIFADVPPDSDLAQNEIFGPVLAVMKARDFDHALDLANNTRYALTGGLYSRSPAHLEAARQRFRVGNLYLNRKITGAVVGRQPFGGFKLSGTDAKAGGPDYLLHFVNPRHVAENTLRRGFAPQSSQAAAETGL